jgi:hypothetical protein
LQRVWLPLVFLLRSFFDHDDDERREWFFTQPRTALIRTNISLKMIEYYCYRLNLDFTTQNDQGSITQAQPQLVFPGLGSETAHRYRPPPPPSRRYSKHDDALCAFVGWNNWLANVACEYGPNNLYWCLAE